MRWLAFRGGIAVVAVGMILLWAILDLGSDWLGFGAGLVTGNLAGFCLRPLRGWSIKRELILLSWVFFALAFLLPIILGYGIFFFFWGSWLATVLNFAGIRADEIWHS